MKLIHEVAIMKRFHSVLLCMASSLLSVSLVSAQNPPQSTDEEFELVDSLVCVPAPAADSSLVGKNIFNELPSKSKGNAADVRVHQSSFISDAMREHIESNSSKQLSGYRVRIFFDNKQSARVDSETVMNKFEELYPSTASYRSYVNPYFKVTVGDFRTRSEAMQFLRMVSKDFPSAFIVRENINFPVVDKNNPTVVDTVKVVRRVSAL